MKRLLSWKTLSGRSELSISTLKRLRESDLDFLRKIQVSPGRVGFYEDDVDRWLESLGERSEVAEVGDDDSQPTDSTSAQIGQDQPVRLDETVEEIVDRLSNERRRS